MLKRDLLSVALGVAGLGLLGFGRSLGTPTAARPAATSAEPTAPPAAPIAVAVPAPPQPPVAAPPPALALEPAPSAPPPAPSPAAPVTPPAVAAPGPARNTDDAPERKKSGKVQVSKDPKLPPGFGPLDAKVHVIVFSDFQCPVCRRVVDATHQVAEEFPGEVRLEFWQHALEMHKNAMNAAAASVAAHLQGKFWEMHDVLFENQAMLDEPSLKEHAKKVGLDMAKFEKDYADEKLRERVKTEGQLADALEARGTPAFAVNGKVSVGWGSWNGFRGQVEAELNQARELAKTVTSPAALHEQRAKQNSKDETQFKAYKAAVIDARAKR